ncbi:MAG TPA: transcription antitermination factor NusB [Candidatus Atribacteria bacterium]|nr:transcription antitermination factor NusB [Candidatus Atribacteria bacterium]
MARRPAREAAMKLLYQREFSEEYDQNLLTDLKTELSLSKHDMEYIQDILEGCIRHRGEIDSIIKERSKGWRFDRLSKVDLAILRLALYEILYRDDIPESVSVNEGVELAKKYGNEKSGSFVNGVLGCYLRSANTSPDSE